MTIRAAELAGAGAILGSLEPGKIANLVVSERDLLGDSAQVTFVAGPVDPLESLVVVVPDGPRGPRCRAKSGVVQLARATGLPIFPVAFAARPSYVLRRSWDWLCIPYPGAKVVYVVGDPLMVEAEASAGEVEAVRSELEQRLNDVTRLADSALGVASGTTQEYTRGRLDPERPEQAA